MNHFVKEKQLQPYVYFYHTFSSWDAWLLIFDFKSRISALFLNYYFHLLMK